jgi:hypothetical protein
MASVRGLIRSAVFRGSGGGRGAIAKTGLIGENAAISLVGVSLADKLFAEMELVRVLISNLTPPTIGPLYQTNVLLSIG